MSQFSFLINSLTLNTYMYTFTLTPFPAGVCRCPEGGLHLGQGEPQEGGEAGDQEVVLHTNPGVGAAASSYRVLSSLWRAWCWMDESQLIYIIKCLLTNIYFLFIYILIQRYSTTNSIYYYVCRVLSARKSIILAFHVLHCVLINHLNSTQHLQFFLFLHFFRFNRFYGHPLVFV